MEDHEPIYKTIKRQLSECLSEGKWKHGQAIPSEPLLARRFGASIGTVRKAIDELVAENILVRQQGRGTFVTSFTRDYMLNVFFTVVNKKGRGKELPDAEMLSFRRTKSDVTTSTELHLKRGSPVFEIQNLLRMEGEPVIVDFLHLPVVLFPDLTESIFQERGSTIFGLYQSRYGITVTRTEDMISAVSADEKICRLLKLKKDPAVLRIVRTSFTYRDRPVDTRIRYVNTTKFSYLSVIGKR